MICGPLALGAASTFGVAIAGWATGAAAGSDAAVTFGVETAATGFRNGFSRNAIAPETPTTAST